MRYCVSATKACAFRGEDGVEYGEFRSILDNTYRCSKHAGEVASFWELISTTLSDTCSYSHINHSGVALCEDEELSVFSGEDRFNLKHSESICLEPEDEEWRIYCGGNHVNTHYICRSSKLAQVSRSSNGKIITWACFTGGTESTTQDLASRLGNLVGAWKSKKFKADGSLTTGFFVTLIIFEPTNEGNFTGKLVVSRKSSIGTRASEQVVRIVLEGNKIRLHPISVENLGRPPKYNDFRPYVMTLSVTDRGNLRGSFFNSSDSITKSMILFRE